MRTVAVIGASGDVGMGVVRMALARQWGVVAIARSAERLAALAAGSAGAIRVLPGSVADDDSAGRLAAALGPVDAVVVCISAPFPLRRLADWPVSDLVALFAENVGAHHAAMRHLLPLVRPGGTFLGVGGGTADVVLPKMAPISVVQAGQRMLYRGLAKEASRDQMTASVRVLELLVSAMVDGASTRSVAGPDWITDDEVGAAVCDLLDGDERGPIVTLTSPRAAVRG